MGREPYFVFFPLFLLSGRDCWNALEVYPQLKMLFVGLDAWECPYAQHGLTSPLLTTRKYHVYDLCGRERKRDIIVNVLKHDQLSWSCNFSLPQSGNKLVWWNWNLSSSSSKSASSSLSAVLLLIKKWCKSWKVGKWDSDGLMSNCRLPCFGLPCSFRFVAMGYFS